MIKGKRIVVISPDFFNLEKAIVNELSVYNTVEWYDERPFKSGINKALNIYFPWLFKYRADNYYNRIIKKLCSTPDYFLIVKGEQVSVKTIKRIRTMFRFSKVILYLWDSIENEKQVKKRIPYYDKVLSFDKADCNKYGFCFRPLFLDNHLITQEEKKEREFDLLFYGTMYSDRFNIVSSFIRYCNSLGLKFYTFCYLSKRFMKIYYRMFEPGYKLFDKKLLDFIPKTKEEIASLLSKSKVVLDINDKNQSGLTMRTIEAIFAGCKIITTNNDIVNYDFYNDSNVYIIDRDNIQLFEIPTSFIDSPALPIDPSIMFKYTVGGWIEDVFGNI